jgi:hypothetical protein
MLLKMTVEGDGVIIKVRGKLNDSDSVTTDKNDVVYQFDAEQGQTSVSAILRRYDGGYIHERVVSQEIRLPDGTEIERSPVTQEELLPDGRVIRRRVLIRYLL